LSTTVSFYSYQEDTSRRNSGDDVAGNDDVTRQTKSKKRTLLVAIQTDLHNHTPVRKSLGFHDHTTSRPEMEEPIHFSAVAVDVDFALAERVVKLPNMLFRSSSWTVDLNINRTA
jgi:hypothetical protein